MRTTAETQLTTSAEDREKADDKASRTLSIAALLFVALAAIMGWGASFVGLHEYGMQSMAGFTYWTAWLVPATFDGAAFACTLMTYRSSINGRSAVRGRILMWAFTAVSSWINWIHQPSPQAQIVAAGLPIAAVAVFDVVLTELRADYEKRHGKRGFRLRPGLLALRWLVDRSSTSYAFRKQVIDIPVEEIAGLGPVAQESASTGSTRSETPVLEEESPEPVIAALPAAGDTATESSAVGSAVGESAAVEDTVGEEKATEELSAEPESVPQPTVEAESAGEPVAEPPESTEKQKSAESHERSVESDNAEQESAADEHGEADDSAAADKKSASSEVDEVDDSQAQTVMLPRLPETPMSDEAKREAARLDYRESLDADQPATGAQLGKRYGMSERWGRTQISAAREELRRERHPRLVAVSASD